MPTSSKMNLLLATPEPMNDGDSISSITDLRGKKPTQQQLYMERGVRICESNSADTRVRKAREAGHAPGSAADSPKSVVKTMVRQLCPCSIWRSTVEQRSICSSWKTLCWTRWRPERGCDCMGSLCRLPAPQREEPMLEQICWQACS
ncbi:protein pxr1-like [Willisornis vidua]|uniref:Protein pxr1-like n=1 Tax=Willisornis vidua TaxID=1566151 RepID=A0ABQ9DMS9_9PASS|nr:protein pxr1-like [Willisornis vidua]